MDYNRENKVKSIIKKDVSRISIVGNGIIRNVKIIHKPGHIYIDCGCVFKKANGKLGCLCLDNMQEYYV